MIQVKNSDVTFFLLNKRYHPKLCLLIKYVSDVAGIYFTEAYRPKKHKHDLHGTTPVRAIDGRASIYTHPAMIADRINAKWIYDPSRPDKKCALYHARCPKCGHDHKDRFTSYCDQCNHDIRNHWHIHYQVHPKTVFVKNGRKAE